MTQPPPHCSDPTGLAPEQSDWVARFDSRLTTGQSYFSQSGAGGSAAYCDDDYHVELWQVYLMETHSAERLKETLLASEPKLNNPNIQLDIIPDILLAQGQIDLLLLFEDHSSHAPFSTQAPAQLSDHLF